MNKRINALIVALACILLLPAISRAQLPNPTYGWNLGNTLEAPCGEGCWGGTASQTLINGVAAAGYNAVRIPCAWDSHANQSTHVIDSAYLNRVKQVVDWCYAKNLYVLVNAHWDGGWLENNIGTSVNSTINAKQQSYWQQIAATFHNYDAKLLFAGANEPNASTSAQMSTLLAYYQTFVTAVRNDGGSNSTRWLILPGPNTNTTLTNDLFNTLPNDPANPDRMGIEVHWYAPWQYVGMTADESWGKMWYFWGANYHSSTMTDRNATSDQEESMVTTEFNKMQSKFTSKGIPVVLGEFWAQKHASSAFTNTTEYNRHVASRTFWHKVTVDYANARGIRPFIWDTPGTFLNWSTGAKTDPDCVTATTGGAALPPPGGGGGGGTTYYKLKNAATGLVIDGKGSTTNGDWCGQWSDVTSNNLQWEIVTAGSYVQLKNRATGMMIDGAGNSTNGADALLWSNSGSNNQQWTQSASGSNFKYQNRATGLYLDGMGRTTAGSHMGQYAGSSSTNQQFSRTAM